MTPRQIAYREYLKTDHWKELRGMALERDGWKCVECQSVEILQVHHRFYRWRFEDSLLEDVMTLCKRCHMACHGRGGYGPTDYELAHKKVDRGIGRWEPGLPRVPKEDWVALRKAVEFPCELEWFADLIFQHVGYVLDNRERASTVRNRIYRRAEALRIETGLP